ncbi:MAG: phosphate/phosphite/phosphonate ABC transporter substrate-binding protein, partial [Microcystaceae cyanobacterium]
KVKRGETLGLVGESGCGKSTLARTLLRLIAPLTGKIWFRKNLDQPLHHPSNEITHLEGESLRKLRRQMQIIFQNPYNSLNPRLPIGRTIMEPMVIHNYLNNQRDRSLKVAELLRQVDLNPNWINRYPHELSGGQRQRVCIARALALNPQLIICDESVSSLDVSVQAQVLNLLKELQQKLGLTYIFISHDLSVVKFMSDRILVMNKEGKIEERGSAEKILHKPQEVYTKNLIRSIPTGRLTINIGAIPEQDPEKLEPRYTQLATYLETELGMSVKYKPMTDYEAAVNAFSSGGIDMAWLGGLTGIQSLLKVSEAEAIIQRDTDTQFRSIFIAHQKCGIEPIQDINGLQVLRRRKFIFGNEFSTSGCLMPQYYLRQAGITPENFENVGFSITHDTTIKLVNTGIYEAGVVSESVWRNWVET